MTHIGSQSHSNIYIYIYIYIYWGIELEGFAANLMACLWYTFAVNCTMWFELG